MDKKFFLYMAGSLLAGNVSAAEIRLHLTGTELEGGPAFEVLLDDVAVGQGVVDPVPPLGGYAEYSFNVPDDQLGSSNRFSVRLTNDAYKEGVGDRNLFVVSARVADIDLAASDFQVFRNGTDLQNSNGRLYSNSDIAIAEAPSSGWFGRKSAGEVESSSSGSAECDAVTVSVTGYPNGIVTTNDTHRAVLTDIPQQAHCQITVVGFSSTIGSEAANKRVALQRAEAVADDLIEAGFPRDQVLVSGEGETEQFGPTQGDNRRVVVSVAPR